MKKSRIIELSLLSLFIGWCIVTVVRVREKRTSIDYRLEQLSTKVSKQLAHQGLTGNQMGVFSFKRGSRIIIIDRVDGDSIGLQDRLGALEKKKLLTKNLNLSEDTYLFLNGSCVGDTPTVKEVGTVLLEIMVRNPGRVFYLRGRGEEQVPFNVYHALNKPYDRLLEQAIRDLFSRLLAGAYIFAEDLKEEPLKLLAVRVSRENFYRISCVPVENQKPLIALCALDSLCSYKEGSVRMLGSTSYSYVIVTMAQTLEKSTVEYYSVYNEKPLKTEHL